MGTFTASFGRRLAAGSLRVEFASTAAQRLSVAEEQPYAESGGSQRHEQQCGTEQPCEGDSCHQVQGTAIGHAFQSGDNRRMKIENVSALIFDMDGVLCDSEPLIAEAAIRMFAERHGIRVRAEDFLPFVGAGEDRYLGGVAEKYGVRLQPGADKARVYEIYLELIPGRLKPIPGAAEFVRMARTAGFRLAVATSADRVKMEGNLREIRLPPETFDAIVTGEDIEHKKPAPDIFLLAARRLGVSPESCVVVEDALNGVRAAKTAGARCLALATGFSVDDLRAAGADWTAPGWDGLKPEQFKS